MSDIEIRGFTDLQKDLADRIWAMDTVEEINHFVNQLPRSLKREAWVVMQMIIMVELDQVEEVTEDVQRYLSSL
jgi:hypothetical protein